MTKREAHAILDGVRAGRVVDAKTITRALQATGDVQDETTQVYMAPGEWRRTDHGQLAPAGVFDGLMQ